MKALAVAVGQTADTLRKRSSAMDLEDGSRKGFVNLETLKLLYCEHTRQYKNPAVKSLRLKAPVLPCLAHEPETQLFRGTLTQDSMLRD